MEQLYLLEVLVQKICFASSITEIPNPRELKIGVLFANLVNLDIESEDIRGFETVTDPYKRIWDLDLGKSILFPCKSKDLLLRLVKSPLQLSLKTDRSPCTIGSVTVAWNPNFIEMVKKSETNPNKVEPASVNEMYELNDDNQTIVANLGVFIRLSSYGHNIETQFQIVSNKDNVEGVPVNKYFFRNINTATTFKAQTYGEDDAQREILPVAPICDPAHKTFFKQNRIRPEDMSTEQLNKVLCKNKNCPGAQKFAQYGIGPAATGSGLGTLYGSCNVPISYGMSHTYGSLENYGPYGVYINPNSSDKPDTSNIESKEGVKNCGCSDPLRLTGGGGQDDDSNMPPQPMAMCKDLMQSFDKVLSAYKKALGPCGQGTCPFAYNIIDDSCKKLCFPQSSDPVNVTTTSPHASITKTPSTHRNVLSACGTPDCPYSRPSSVPADKRFQSKQLKSACGKPTCSFTKQRLGVANDDDMMELQYMNACCKSAPLVPLPPLEPIHWDCPEPLPKGACRNPQCPLKPKELRYIPRGPCGNEQCPFAPPPFCGDTNCPFSPPQPCPNAQPNIPPQATCGDPNCPFAPKPPPPSCPPSPPCFTSSIMPCCVNPTCPANPPTCGDPTCPLNPQPQPCPGARLPSTSRRPSPCYISDKPSPSFVPESKKDVCDNPQCPFQQTQDKNSICSNPACPYKKNIPSVESICSNPKCPYREVNVETAKGADSICSNPECPFGVNTERVKGDDTNVLPCELELGGAKITVDQRRSSSRKTSLGAGDDGESTQRHIPNNTPNTTNNSPVSSEAVKGEKKRKGRKRNSRYVYKLGDLYPGVNIGHRECIIPGRNVPAKMGWAWNIHVPCVGLKPRRGWRPGCVHRTIAARILAHRKKKGLNALPLENCKSGQKRSKSRYDSDSDRSVAPKPTLQVKKRDGTYVITMNPLKDPKTIEDNENPYMECSPLQFKITKNKDSKDESRSCYCEDEDSSSSSDSELDIEFTPPAGIIRPERLKRKKNVVHTDTQYNTADFDPKPIKPQGKGKGKGKGKDKGKKKKK